MSRVKAVRHPYILSLERYDIIDGQLIIVMELADRNLWDRFKECRTQGLAGIPREELMRYTEETAEALDLMNQQYQLQHLDIKPQNLFLVTDHIKVADFGLAKDLEGTHASVTGGVTPVYAAPEIFDGSISRFCDQYSLAIVFQELLTGRRPFNGVNVRQLILQHLQAVPDVSSLPEADRPVISRALAKTANERWPSCRDMVKLLRQNTLPPLSADRETGRQGDKETRPSVSLSPGLPVSRSAKGSNGQGPRAEVDHPGTVPAANGEIPPEQPWQDDSSSGVSHSAGLASGGHPASDRSLSAGLPLSAFDGLVEDSEASPRTTRMILRGTASQVEPASAQSRQPFKEVKGDGVLFPALLLAVGQTGLTVMQRLREILVERFESLDRLPHLRMLLLDTDPSAVASCQLAVGSKDRGMSSPTTANCQLATARAALSSNDILLAGLNRPSYYLKERASKLDLDSWFNSRMLYRIPPSLVTAGVRALGRLAFCDNFRAIQRRLQSDLEAILDMKTLTSSAQQTKLGLRTNRPRVYLLCGLAGGTGSGMFLDLAYTVRAILRGLGFEQPDVVGLFLLPPLESHQTRVMALGNAHAALTELKHYGSPGARFRAQYAEREQAVEDSAPPFSRYFLLPLPDETDESASREVFDTAGQFLYRDLCTMLGREVDLARAEVPAPPWNARGRYYQTFGLSQLCWPRAALCRQVGQCLCQMLVQRWLSKDSKLMREPIQEWVREQWSQLGLGAERWISRLRDRCQEALGKPPETIFHGLLEPLLNKVTQSPATQRRGAAAIELTPEEIAPVLAQIEEWIGKPRDELLESRPRAEDVGHDKQGPGRMIEVLREAAESALNEATQQLAELSVRLIEEPAYRLAGAEEAVRQLMAQVEQVLQQQEPLCRELTANADETFLRLQTLLATQQRRPRALPTSSVTLPAREVVDLLRSYAKNRFQSQVLLQVSAGFLSLRGSLSDQLREINFCRVRLTELLRQFESCGSPRDSFSGISKPLFPSGCASQSDATGAFLARVTPEVLLDLDGRMEEMLKQKFTALVNVCLTSANILKNVEQEMLHTSKQFAEELLDETDAARLFLDQQLDPEEQAGRVQDCYEESAPELPPSRVSHTHSLTLLATPPGEAGDAFQNLAGEVLSDVEVHRAASPDDVVFYRELVNLPLAELPHLTSTAQLAYRQMNATGNFTPHTRIDIDFTGSER